MDVKEFIANNWKKGLAIIVGAVGLVGAGSFFVDGMKPVEIDGEIMLKSWDRHIYIQKLETVKKSGWTVPKGGRVYDTRWEYKSTERVPSGVDQNGKTCYREESRYATKYYYEIDEWKDSRVKVTNGTETTMRASEEPHWPEVKDLQEGAERVGRKTENYEITIKVHGTGEIKTFSVNQTAWNLLKPSDCVKVTYGKFTSSRADSVELLD